MKDERCRKAIEVAERFGLGENIPIEKLEEIAHTIYPIARITHSATAYFITHAVAAVTNPHVGADYVAAIVATFTDGAKIKNQQETANICKDILGKAIVVKVNLLLK